MKVLSIWKKLTGSPPTPSLSRAEAERAWDAACALYSTEGKTRLVDPQYALAMVQLQTKLPVMDLGPKQ